MKSKLKKNCLTCANWRENPEQCYGCIRNSDNSDCWRPVGSAGFTRDAGKPLNPKMPKCRLETIINI